MYVYIYFFWNKYKKIYVYIIYLHSAFPNNWINLFSWQIRLTLRWLNAGKIVQKSTYPF